MDDSPNFFSLHLLSDTADPVFGCFFLFFAMITHLEPIGILVISSMTPPSDGGVT